MLGGLRKKLASLRRPGTRTQRSPVGRSRPQFEQLEPRLVLNGGPLAITEFMANNNTGLTSELTDDDGRRLHPDWIEVYNPSETAVPLLGWSLTDDADDLTQWEFPDVTIEAGDYLVVFASGRDVNTAGGEMHTNFKLGSNGEYLALVQPDGFTISHEYAPEYPKQYGDFSYGITQEFTPLVDAETDLLRHVPTVVDAEADWTAPDFDDSAWPGKGAQSPILITEAGSGTPDYIEIQNTSDEIVNTSGWFVALNKGTSQDINTFHSTVWYLPETMAPGQVLYKTDIGEEYFGEGIYWSSGGKGGAMIVDADGNVADFAAWSYSATEIASMSITIEGFPVRASSSWKGPAVTTSANTTLMRVGNQDHDDASDFEFVPYDPTTRGNQNQGLVLPVIGGRLPGIGFDTAEDGFGRTIETDVAGSMHEKNGSLWARYEFDVENPAALTGLQLHIKYNDGFIAYLNGHEISRSNAPASPAWNSTATSSRTVEESMRPRAFNVSDSLPHLVPEGNVLAIQGLNVAAADGDFLLVPELLATETDAIERYFASPSPGGPNEGSFLGMADEPQFSAEHGIFEDSFLLTLTSESIPGATTVYTLNGSEPTRENGEEYIGPITIDKTTVIRAATYGSVHEMSRIGTRTYLFPADVVTQSSTGQAPGPEWPTGSVNGQMINYGMDPDIVNNGVWGPQMTDALTSIPTMSIVTDLDNLFDSSIGIFVNARSDGPVWERPASLELIYPDGASGPGFPDVVDATPGDGFQIDMGLRIRGGYSRTGNNPKHAFRFFFKGDYDGQLEYPLFGDEGTDLFSNVDLRTSQNYSWAFGGPNNNTMIREVFSRDIQGAMGQPYTRSRFYHLYLNGQYWGLFQTQERSEANFNASYLGGNSEDYDVVKQDDGRHMFATDGNMAAYSRLHQETLNGFSDNADYYRVQGLNPDGTPNPAYEKLLDVDNLIDYMIITYYSGDRDGPGSRYTTPHPNNFWGSYDREDPDGFQFFEHDSEHSLGTGEYNMVSPLQSIDTRRTEFVHFNAHWLHEQIAFVNDEYVMRFADRLHKHFFNDGVLSLSAARKQLDYRVAQINKAIIAESARWGDMKANPPRNYNDWMGDVNEVYAWIGARTGTVINQVRNLSFGGKVHSWYPSVFAPELSKHGGEVAAGFEVTFRSVPSGSTVYYTLDGSDPRTIGGNVLPTALTYSAGTPIPLDHSTLFRARALKNGKWSASTEAQFFIGTPAAAANLLISELNYNPYPPTDEELLLHGFDPDLTPAERSLVRGYFGNDDFEFIEIYNASAGPIDLTGARFTDGIAFEFGSDDGPLGPGESVVVVNNLPAFEARYGTSAKDATIRIAGEYRQSFSNAGEGITLVDRFGEIILDFSYNDAGAWPGRADGTGASLTLIDPATVPATEPERTDFFEDGNNWRSSVEFGGSPGVDALPRIDQVVVNEVFSHTHDPDIDTIELLNLTGGPINIGGWYLSDSNDNLMKYRIEDNTILQPGEYLLFDEDDFNPSRGVDPILYPNDFALNGAHGDDVWLMKADATGLTQFADHAEFDASLNTETMGRWPNGEGRFVPMAQNTLDAANTGPRVGPVVISEVHYHPTIPDNNDHEFVEIYN
ncbi:MAG: lamin tail domain-containing protein, partial [Thermoguttaceae bacterium]